MSVASQSGFRPIDVNGGEEVVAVGSGIQGACRKKRRKRPRQEKKSVE